MNRLLPFFMTVIVFILVWSGLMLMPYIESVSPNRAIEYATFSFYIAIIVFVILASIYHFENYDRCSDELMGEFTYDYSSLTGRTTRLVVNQDNVASGKSSKS
jgi:hypothetical protein